MMYSRFRKRIAIGLALVLTVVSSLQASASNKNISEAEAQMENLAKRYGSLSAAMAESYAINEGVSLKSFILGKPGTFSDLSGVNTGTLTGLTSSNKNLTINELDLLLQDKGLTLSSLAFSSLEKAALEVRSKSQSYDAAVIQAGMLWADTLYKLNVPALKYPDAPAMDASVVTGMPSEGLVFGMFTNRALNNFVRDFPDVFSQVNKSGIGSDKQLAVWNTSIKQAMNNSRPDLSSMLPGACGKSFLDGLSGSSASNGCSPCNAAGLLGNAQLSLIFNPEAGSTLDKSDATISPSEWAKLSPKQRESVLKQNPTLSKVISGSSGAENGCTSIKPAVQSSIDSVLPKVLDFLESKP
ncbi:MAG: hypothetical protein ACKOW9_05090 [Candidatus Paceibacterota bacterium]